MITLIEDNRDAIVELCERFGVRRLALFGSAAKGTYDPATSDIDLLVDLGDYDDRVGKRFMGFAVAIEGVLGPNVHITTIRSVQSEWFRRELAETAQTIYEADASAAA